MHYVVIIGTQVFFVWYSTGIIFSEPTTDTIIEVDGESLVKTNVDGNWQYCLQKDITRQ